jgi:hypothetical protein
MQELIRQDKKGEQYTTIADLIAKYRSYYRRTRPVTSSLSTFATLGITQSKDSEAAPPQRRSITCLCGDNHKFEDCPYVNSSLQQPTWTPDKAVEKKFSKLRQSRSSLAAALKRVESQLQKEGKLTAEVKKQSVIYIDNRKPVSNTTHCNAMLQTTAAAAASSDQPPLLTR